MKNKTFCCLISLLVLMTLPIAASALCLGCSCTVTATGVSFGNYNPFGSNVDATGNVRVSCRSIVTLGTINYSATLNKGLYGADFTPRQMANSSYRLDYYLYSDSGHTANWGNGTDGTVIVTGAITLFILLDSAYVDHPIYGRIPGSQTTAHVGSYSDTITVTIDYN